MSDNGDKDGEAAMRNSDVDSQEQQQQRKISNKERMAMFQSSITQLTAENDVSNVRQLLRERYQQAKKAEQEAEEEKLRRQREEQAAAAAANQTSTSTRSIDTSRVGRQLARVFRFGRSNNGNNLLRARGAHGQRRPQIDPFDEDPNVLLQNFGWQNEENDDVNDDRHRRRVGANDHDDGEDEDIDDDSFGSLWQSFFRDATRTQILWLVVRVVAYVAGQTWATQKGFGAVFFAIALLVFVCTNLRSKAPGELSAYSVFNPFCQHIPSTVGEGQPPDNIVLLGQL